MAAPCYERAGDRGAAKPPRTSVVTEVDGGPLCLNALVPETVGRVRQVVTSQLSRWNIGDDLQNPVLLCLSELLANVVRHVPGRSCSLTLEYGPALRLVVRDSSSDLPEVRTAADLDESGRGLLLIDAIASRWGAKATSSGKDVWVEFDRTP